LSAGKDGPKEMRGLSSRRNKAQAVGLLEQIKGAVASMWVPVDEKSILELYLVPHFLVFLCFLRTVTKAARYANGCIIVVVRVDINFSYITDSSSDNSFKKENASSLKKKYNFLLFRRRKPTQCATRREI
jgi:hypothetical protein